MKKRILAFVLTLAMMASTLAMFASAVPYSPSANAWKDFGQEHNYIYEVTYGNAAPTIDGYVTENDGYGEPIASYGFRYVTTSEQYAPDFEQGEYKLKDNGDYYVYPTQDSADEIWNSITSMETDNPFGYIFTYYQQGTTYSATTAYYYHNDSTGNFARAYKLTEDTFAKYTAMDSAGNYILANGTIQTLKGEPVDWETNYMDYYTKVGSAYKPVEAGADGKAPAFKSATFYHGQRIVVDRLFIRRNAGSNNSVARVAWLKRDHTFVPEEVNLYARYDEQYLYYAIEVVEPEHKNIYYNNSNYWGTTMSNSPGVFTNAYDFANYYRMNLTESFARSNKLESIRTYVSGTTALNSGSYVYILAKFGSPEADYQKAVLSGIDYNITHTPAPVKDDTTQDETDDGFGYDDGLGETEDPVGANGIKESLRSGTYGTTVYEYRLPWTVINGKYSPDTCSTAVPEMFTVSQSIQLDNNVGRDTHTLSLSMPKYVYNAPSSFGREYYLFRHPDTTGLRNDAESYGTYNFYWRCISGVTVWDVEAFTTDYATVANYKRYSPAVVLPVFFTAGQEPSDGYVQPSYAGANIRVDGSDAQKMRIKINVPNTDKEIAEVGAIVAPTEVVRDIQLRLGISSVAYYGFETPVLYGIVDGKWVNLTTDADKYFASSATPNDSDSFISYEEYGGKPSGVYTVYTLPADLESPYSSDENGSIYTVVFGGANGEGLYNDFDDFNTFYTIRPYIKYTDGTVTYGEHEYKSIYYIACNLIQPMLTDYNYTVVGIEKLSEVEKKYNMDNMYLETLKDADGNVMNDKNGNPIYVPVATTPNTYSPHAGSGEYSIYLDSRRQEVFLWYAIRTVGRRNGNTPLRLDEYETFDANTKLLVQQYMEMYENVWNVIETAENNRYITMPE